MSLITKLLFSTYGSLEGRFPWGNSAAGVSPGAGPSGEDFFPRFEALASGSSKAVLFSPWREGFSIPPFLKASLAEAVASLFPPSPSSKGMASSILANTGSGVVSGRGAGHRISFASAIHSCSGDNFLKSKNYDEYTDKHVRARELLT